MGDENQTFPEKVRNRLSPSNLTPRSVLFRRLSFSLLSPDALFPLLHFRCFQCWVFVARRPYSARYSRGRRKYECRDIGYVCIRVRGTYGDISVRASSTHRVQHTDTKHTHIRTHLDKLISSCAPPYTTTIQYTTPHHTAHDFTIQPQPQLN